MLGNGFDAEAVSIATTRDFSSCLKTIIPPNFKSRLIKLAYISDGHYCLH